MSGNCFRQLRNLSAQFASTTPNSHHSSQGIASNGRFYTVSLGTITALCYPELCEKRLAPHQPVSRQTKRSGLSLGRQELFLKRVNSCPYKQSIAVTGCPFKGVVGGYIICHDCVNVLLCGRNKKSVSTKLTSNNPKPCGSFFFFLLMPLDMLECFVVFFSTQTEKAVPQIPVFFLELGNGNNLSKTRSFHGTSIYR